MPLSEVEEVRVEVSHKDHLYQILKIAEDSLFKATTSLVALAAIYEAKGPVFELMVNLGKTQKRDLEKLQAFTDQLESMIKSNP